MHTCKAELSQLWDKYSWDALPFLCLGLTYGIMAVILGDNYNVSPHCHRASSNQNLDNVNVPAAVSSIFLAAAAISVRISQWPPTRVYAIVLSVFSFGYWWTQCWRPYQRYDVFFSSLIVVIVADGCIRNKWVTAGLYTIMLIYGLAALLSPRYIVRMAWSTAVPGLIVLSALVVYCIVGVNKNLPALNVTQICTSVMFLVFAGLSLGWSSMYDCNMRDWWQPVCVGHLCAGIALYVSSTEVVHPHRTTHIPLLVASNFN